MDLAAPGVDIVGPVPAGYAIFNGTSQAAPHVAGVAGLVKSQNPGYTPVQVKNAIMNSVDHPAGLGFLMALGDMATGDFTKTSGRVNALQALTGSTDQAAPITDGNIDGALALRSAQGEVAWPEDVNDVYEKRLRKGARYRVVLDGPPGQDFDLVIWKPGTEEIWQLEDACFVGPARACKLLAYLAGPIADESRVFRAPASGVFYFQVNSFFSEGSYRLTVQRLGR